MAETAPRQNGLGYVTHMTVHGTIPNCNDIITDQTALPDRTANARQSARVILTARPEGRGGQARWDRSGVGRRPWRSVRDVVRPEVGAQVAALGPREPHTLVFE